MKEKKSKRSRDAPTSAAGLGDATPDEWRQLCGPIDELMDAEVVSVPSEKAAQLVLRAVGLQSPLEAAAVGAAPSQAAPSSFAEMLRSSDDPEQLRPPETVLAELAADATSRAHDCASAALSAAAAGVPAGEPRRRDGAAHDDVAALAAVVSGPPRLSELADDDFESCMSAVTAAMSSSSSSGISSKQPPPLAEDVAAADAAFRSAYMELLTECAADELDALRREEPPMDAAGLATLVASLEAGSETFSRVQRPLLAASFHGEQSWWANRAATAASSGGGFADKAAAAAFDAVAREGDGQKSVPPLVARVAELRKQTRKGEL